MVEWYGIEATIPDRLAGHLYAACHQSHWLGLGRVDGSSGSGKYPAARGHNHSCDVCGPGTPWRYCDSFSPPNPAVVVCLHGDQRQVAVHGDLASAPHRDVVERPLALEPRERTVNGLPWGVPHLPLRRAVPALLALQHPFVSLVDVNHRAGVVLAPRQVAEYQSWGVKEIGKRQNKLAKLAVLTWPS